MAKMYQKCLAIAEQKHDEKCKEAIEYLGEDGFEEVIDMMDEFFSDVKKRSELVKGFCIFADMIYAQKGGEQLSIEKELMKLIA